MSLHIKSEQTGDVAVLRVLKSCGAVRHSIFLRSGDRLKQPRVVVLDLSAVEMVDGGGARYAGFCIADS